MPKLTDNERRYAVRLLEERQQEDCKKKGVKWHGTYCESGGYEKRDSAGHSCRGGIIVHHIDGDPQNNPMDGSNWRFECRGHNARLDARGIKAHLPSGERNIVEHKGIKVSLKRVRERRHSGAANELSVTSAEFEKNMRCEPKFRECVEMILNERSSARVQELAAAGAEYTTQIFGAGRGIDTQTALRYLQKMYAPFIGRYERFNMNSGDGIPDWHVRKIDTGNNIGRK